MLTQLLAGIRNGSGDTGHRSRADGIQDALALMTVSRCTPRCPAEPDLRNHKDDIAAMVLFTVPTASLRLLYAFFVIEHGHRHIVHFKATFHPSSNWVIQQLREAFPYDTAPRYLIFDRDSIFSAAVVEFIKTMGAKPVRISYRSPSSASDISFGSLRINSPIMKTVVTWDSIKKASAQGNTSDAV